MENVVRVIDDDEADAIFVVGGDGTLSRVLSGMYANETGADRLPLAVFPGGAENRSLRKLISSLFIGFTSFYI